MQAGRLDREITIEQPVKTQDAYGAERQSWSTLATVWAEKRDLRGREFFAAQQVNAEVETVFKIRHRSDVTPEMRISYDGAIYDILGLVELGRREALEIMTKRRVD